MSLRLRHWSGAALVPAAAFAVHQLRYVLTFRSGAGRELAAQGHSYLHEVTPWIVLACGLAFGAFLVALSRAWRTGRADESGQRSFVALWLVAAGGLVGLYAGQEFLEGLFATGHPEGLAGIFGAGGLWAIPAALAVGLLLALLIRGARKAVALVARRRVRPLVALAAPAVARRPRPAYPRQMAPLATSAAGRAPPFALDLIRT